MQILTPDESHESTVQLNGILTYDEPRYLSLLKTYLMHLTDLQSIFVNIIVEMIIEGNELYFDYKTSRIEEHLKEYLMNMLDNAMGNGSDNDNGYNKLIRRNGMFFIKYISYMISLYVGEYGFSRVNDDLQIRLYSGQIVSHRVVPRSRDVVCAVSDEEILSNKNKYGYWYSDILNISKNDEAWIGVYWNESFPTEHRSYGGGIRRSEHIISYYGGREVCIRRSMKQFLKQHDIEYTDDNFKSIMNNHDKEYREWFFTQNGWDFDLSDGGFGSIHACGNSKYSDKPLRWYSDGDTVGIYVNVDQKWVQFYCNAVKQGSPIKLPSDVNKLWAFVTTDYKNDALYFQRKLYM